MATTYTPAEVDSVKDAVLDSVVRPERMRSADGEEILERPVPDLIAAVNHVAAEASSAGAQFGMRFTQLIPPGGGGTP